MKQETLIKYLELLQNIQSTNSTIQEYCKNHSTSYSNIINTISKIRNSEDSILKQQIMNLYQDLTNSYSAPESDNRSEISYERDNDGHIQYYAYTIYKRNQNPLVGKLSRDEMNTIYRLYSWYGDSLQQRIVSRYFPTLSLIDFKRVLRAFNITKASSPFAPHMFEEYSEEELREMQLREKENSFLRKAEEDNIRNTEKLLKKYAQENIDLRDQLKKARFTVDLKNIQPYKVECFDESNKIINLYLSDMHIGASITSGSLYKENINYGTDEIIRRLKAIISKLTEIGPFSKINLVLLGDNIDCCGIYGKTARLDHDMPENMDPREQANNFLSIMKWFIESLLTTFNSQLAVYSVPCGNHAGNYEYICNKALMESIHNAFPDVYTKLWEEFYGIFEVNGLRFVSCHGKDAQFMKKPMPLNMNDKTQLMLYEWLDNRNIYGDNIHFIKGDLHSNSLSSCKKLSYRNVLSLFGASDYSDANYSKNSYGMSYDLIINQNLIRGTIENI